MQLVTGQRMGRQADLAQPAEFHTPAEDIVPPAFDLVEQAAVNAEHRFEDWFAGRVEVVVEGARPRVKIARPSDLELHQPFEAAVTNAARGLLPCAIRAGQI